MTDYSWPLLRLDECVSSVVHIELCAFAEGDKLVLCNERTTREAFAGRIHSGGESVEIHSCLGTLDGEMLRWDVYNGWTKPRVPTLRQYREAVAMRKKEST